MNRQLTAGLAGLLVMLVIVGAVSANGSGPSSGLVGHLRRGRAVERHGRDPQRHAGAADRRGIERREREPARRLLAV